MIIIDNATLNSHHYFVCVFSVSFSFIFRILQVVGHKSYRSSGAFLVSPISFWTWKDVLLLASKEMWLVRQSSLRGLWSSSDQFVCGWNQKRKCDRGSDHLCVTALAVLGWEEYSGFGYMIDGVEWFHL